MSMRRGLLAGIVLTVLVSVPATGGEPAQPDGATIAEAVAAQAPEAAGEDGAMRSEAGAQKPAPSGGAPAKQVFGAFKAPNAGPSHVIGFYANGCLSGAQALPVTGPTWQVMRLSRNRNWGHPALIALIERLSRQVKPAAGWPGILVGDIAQPRGGPMLSGHASHQIGLDADIWLTPMPTRELSPAERESMEPTNLVAADWNDVDPATWSSADLRVLKAAAELPEVERIFVNPAIKKAICREAGADRGWLAKVRPMYGHNYHFHVRIKCPAGETACKPQIAPPGGDGCGAELAYWFSDAVRRPKPKPEWPVVPPKPLPLSALPAACQALAAAP